MSVLHALPTLILLDLITLIIFGEELIVLSNLALFDLCS
jgi:hypothetical protein